MHKELWRKISITCIISREGEKSFTSVQLFSREIRFWFPKQISYLKSQIEVWTFIVLFEVTIPCPNFSWWLLSHPQTISTEHSIQTDPVKIQLRLNPSSAQLILNPNSNNSHKALQNLALSPSLLTSSSLTTPSLLAETTPAKLASSLFLGPTWSVFLWALSSSSFLCLLCSSPWKSQSFLPLSSFFVVAVVAWLFVTPWTEAH